MLGRRAFLAGISSLMVAPGRSEAIKTSRIGLLLNRSADLMTHIDAFGVKLRDLGYTEGRNLIIEREAPDRYEELPERAARLVGLNPDVIVAYGTAAVMAAVRPSTTTPVVMIAVGDPVGAGFVQSLARPGGRITGISILHGELAGKRVELLKEILPSARRIALLWHSLNPGNTPILQATEVAAAKLGLSIDRVDVKGPEHLQTALSAVANRRPDGLVPLPDGMLSAHRDVLISFARTNRLPLISANSEWPQEGALMSYGPDFADHWRRAAVYVDKILKGAKPADLPVEQPTTFELIINLKTAKALGLSIPTAMLLRANNLIE